MGIAVGSFYVGVLHVRGKFHGWSEKYDIGGAASYGNAQSLLELLAQARSMILAEGFEICHARVSKLDVKRERRALANLPRTPLNLDTEAGPPVAIGACNDVSVAVQLALETAGGAWANRLIRGIRDTWVTGHVCTVTPSIPAAITLVDTVAGKTAAVALGTFMRALMQVSVHKYPDTTPGQEGTYISEPWDTVVVAQVTKRDTGRAFRSGRGRAPVFTNP